jgi:hypothetical protein
VSNYDVKPLLSGETRQIADPKTGHTVVYMHAGEIELRLADPVSREALIKLRNFVDGMIADPAISSAR